MGRRTRRIRQRPFSRPLLLPARPDGPRQASFALCSAARSLDSLSGGMIEVPRRGRSPWWPYARRWARQGRRAARRCGKGRASSLASLAVRCCVCEVQPLSRLLRWPATARALSPLSPSIAPHPGTQRGQVRASSLSAWHCTSELQHALIPSSAALFPVPTPLASRGARARRSGRPGAADATGPLAQALGIPEQLSQQQPPDRQLIRPPWARPRLANEGQGGGPDGQGKAA
jgi:hypothetical protein